MNTEDKESKEAQSALETLANDPYLTVEEAAALAGAHPETVRRWCRKGVLPHFQAGPKKRYHIPVSALLPRLEKAAALAEVLSNLLHDAVLHN